MNIHILHMSFRMDIVHMSSFLLSRHLLGRYLLGVEFLGHIINLCLTFKETSCLPTWLCRLQVPPAISDGEFAYFT